MRKLLVFLILLMVALIGYNYRNEIFEYIVLNYIYKAEFISDSYNEYKLDYNYEFIQQTDSYKPKNKQDILNIIYSGLNNGWEEFSFFCSTEYENCMEDAKFITSDAVTVSYINNFVHPYNSFSNIKTSINNLGKVTINVSRLYDDDEIQILNNKVDEIYNQVTNDNMNDMEKIRAIHDYIINNSVYDSERADNLNNDAYIPKYRSQKAYGPLIEGYGICGGYSDAMALFLDKMGIQNFKISSENHIWNFVYLNGSWYHLDLTWDDPVVNTKENMLLHNFFLITSSELAEKNTGQHDYDLNIFVEAK